MIVMILIAQVLFTSTPTHMKLFTVHVTRGSPIVPVFGFAFKQIAGNAEAFLDDSMLTIGLDLDLTGPVEKDSASIVVEDGFINFPERILGRDECNNSDSVLVHFKVRLDRTSPPCIIETTSFERHKPVAGRKSDDRMKSSIFEITPDKPVTVKVGSGTYLFRCENGQLLMNDITQASWPEIPSTTVTPELPQKSKKHWWSFLRKRNRFRRLLLRQREIQIVDCR